MTPGQDSVLPRQESESTLAAAEKPFEATLMGLTYWKSTLAFKNQLVPQTLQDLQVHPGMGTEAQPVVRGSVPGDMNG